MADFIGTVHHEMVFTLQEGMDAIRDVIYHLETYDVTTIRAATPMYLMSRKIKSMVSVGLVVASGPLDIVSYKTFFCRVSKWYYQEKELMKFLLVTCIFTKRPTKKNCNRN